MKKINVTNLLISIVLTELIGMLSGFLVGNSKAFYETLFLPPFSPPSWIFPVVWGILYALMGVAAYLIFEFVPPSTERKKAFILYAVQLAFNFLWTLFFFRLELLWGSIAVIILVDIIGIITTIKFYKLKKSAGYFLIPYLIWILFATYLNIGIALLN